MAFVVDASIAMGWLLPSQADALTIAAETALTREAGLVPSHFGIEVGRVLRRFERSGSIDAATVDEAVERLRGLPLQQDMAITLDVVGAVVSLARRHTLRVADATYLELALRVGSPLATRDGRLASVARRLGVPLFTE